MVPEAGAVVVVVVLCCGAVVVVVRLCCGAGAVVVGAGGAVLLVGVVVLAAGGAVLGGGEVVVGAASAVVPAFAIVPAPPVAPDLAVSATASPTGSRVRENRRVETPASICSSTTRVSGSRSAKCA